MVIFLLLAMLGCAFVSHAASQKSMRQSEQEGPLQLSLSDCLLLARQRNFDILLTQEALIQADAKISRAKATMLPFLGAEGLYTGLDEELGFSMGPQSLIFMDKDIYRAGIVVRQPIYIMGGRLNAARKASQYSRDAQAQENRAIEKEITFQVTRAYRIAQVAGAFRKVAVEGVDLL